MAFSAPRTTEDKHSGATFRGKEILLVKSSGAPKQGLVAMGIEKGIFPEEKKIEAATVFAVTGSVQKTAELTALPEYQIRNWRKTEWFQALLKEVKAENNEKVVAKFTEVINKALDLVMDRLENGDYHVTKDGDIIRRPVSGKDLSLITAINFDKRQIAEGQPTAISESVSKDERVIQKLEKLAESFKHLAALERKPVEFTDVEYEEVKIKPNA